MALSPSITSRALKRMTPYHHGLMVFRSLDQGLTSIQGLRRGSRINITPQKAIDPPSLASVGRQTAGLLWQGGSAARLTGSRARRATKVKMSCALGYFALLPADLQRQIALGVVAHVELTSSHDGLGGLLLTSAFVLQHAHDKAGYARATAAWRNFFVAAQLDMTEAAYDASGRMFGVVSPTTLKQLGPTGLSAKALTATDAAQAVFDTISKAAAITDGQETCENAVTAVFAIGGALVGAAAAGGVSAGLGAVEGGLSGAEGGHIGGELWGPSICTFGSDLIDSLGNPLEFGGGGTDKGGAKGSDQGTDTDKNTDSGVDKGSDGASPGDPAVTTSSTDDNTTSQDTSDDTEGTNDQDDDAQDEGGNGSEKDSSGFPNPDDMPDPDGAGGFTADTYSMMSFAQARLFLGAAGSGIFVAKQMPSFTSATPTTATLGDLKGMVSAQDMSAAQRLGLTQASPISAISVIGLSTLKAQSLGSLKQVAVYGGRAA